MPDIPVHHTHVTDIDISGVKVGVYVNRNGLFYTYGPNGAPLKVGYATYDDIVQASYRPVRRLARIVRVPFKDAEGTLLMATGEHATTSKILVRSGSKKIQMDDYEVSKAFKPDTPDEVFSRLVTIQREMNALDREQRELLVNFKMDLRLAVKVAIDAEIDKEDEASWKTSDIPVEIVTESDGENDDDGEDDDEGDPI